MIEFSPQIYSLISVTNMRSALIYSHRFGYLSWSDVGEGGGEEDSADHPDERGGQTEHPVHGRPILEIEIELILNWIEID